MANIKNVEIMRAGTWNGDKFTLEHIKSLAENFLKAGYDVPVKLGHTKLAGAPAYGWLKNVRAQGDRLFADFTDVPGEIVDMIRKKMFNHVSSEIYYNLTRDGKTLNRALKAVALLGAEIPAVAGLKPLSDSDFNFDADCDSVMAFEQDLDKDLAAFMAEHGSDVVKFSVPFLKSLNYTLDTEVAQGDIESISFRLETLPNELVDGLLTEFGLDAKASNLNEICGAQISSNSHISGSIEPLSDLLCRKLTGEFSLKPKQQEVDMTLLKMLSQIIIARAAGGENRETLIKEFADAAKIKVADFTQMLEGTKTVELSEAQTEALAAVMVPAKDDGGNATVAELSQQLADERAKNSALEGDNSKVVELSAKIERLEAEGQDRKNQERVALVRVPSLRAAFRGLYELADKASDKVRLYSTDSKDFKETDAVEVVDSLRDLVNTKLSALLSEDSDGGHDFDLEGGNDESAGDELDRLALAYQAEHSEKSYDVAASKVLEANPELNTRYAREG